MNKLLAVLLFATSLSAEPLVLVGGRLIDGYGGTPIENSVIVIEGNTIQAVGTESSLPIPRGARVIDTNGYTVLPGLMDMHVHLMILGHGDYDHWDRTYPSQQQLLRRDRHDHVAVLHRCGEEKNRARRDPRSRACSSPVRFCRSRTRRSPRRSVGS